MDIWFRSVCCCAEPGDHLRQNGNGEWKDISQLATLPSKSANTLLPSSYPPKGVAGEMQASTPLPQGQSPIGNGHRGDTNGDRPEATWADESTRVDSETGAADGPKSKQEDESTEAAGRLPQPILQKEKSDREKIAELKSGDVFRVKVTRSEEQLSLGIDINHADGESLVVEMVHKGLIQDWNNEHKDARDGVCVLVGDRIVEVNGHRGDALDLIHTIRQTHEFEFLIERGG